MNLDEGLRTRLRAVIEKEPEGGDGRRWDRLASRVAEAGPGVLRSARRRRAVVLAGSVLLALAAPVTAWLLLRTAGGASTAPPRPRSRISAVRDSSRRRGAAPGPTVRSGLTWGGSAGSSSKPTPMHRWWSTPRAGRSWR